MKKLVMLLLGLLPTLLGAETIKVVATLPSLAAIAQQVGAEHVEVVSLAYATEDPHFVDPKPSMRVKLNRADLLVFNGLELEKGWLEPLLVSARNIAIQTGRLGHLDASTVVQVHHHHGPIDRSMGDVHPGGNPHFLYNPRAGLQVARAVKDRLVLLAPHKKTPIQASYRKFKTELQATMSRQEQKFMQLTSTQRQWISYHESFHYLAEWLKVRQTAFLEPKPGIPPNPRHVAKILTMMKGQQGTSPIRVILQEAFYPSKVGTTLAKLAGGQLVIIDGGARFQEGESYPQHIQNLTDRIHDAMQ